MRFFWSLLTQNPLGVFDISISNPPWTSSSSIVFNDASSLSADPGSCPINSPVSCHNETVFSDSCCLIYPSGQLLSTQFWDSDPAVGPPDSWTIHGLWPDNCDGTYPTYCSSAPQYQNISEIISEASPSLFEFINTYWLPNRSSRNSFWMHEWNKHGTCINTLSRSCFDKDQYKPGIEVVEYFQRSVDLFKKLNTYQALKSSGILPSFRKTYTSKQIQESLKKVTGQQVILGCQGSRLNEVWYTFNVKGSLQEGEFVPTYGVHKSPGDCPKTGIRYLPKNNEGRTYAIKGIDDQYN